MSETTIRWSGIIKFINDNFTANSLLGESVKVAKVGQYLTQLWQKLGGLRNLQTLLAYFCAATSDYPRLRFWSSTSEHDSGHSASQSYGASLAICDDTMFPIPPDKRTHLALTTARQAGTRFTYPGGMEGWVDLGDWLYTEMVYLRPAHRRSPCVGVKSGVNTISYPT